MFTKIITTITTEIDIETFETSHSMEIDAGELGAVSQRLVLKAVEGALKSGLLGIADPAAVAGYQDSEDEG